MPVSVSVVICTWNRAGLLDQTLARMRELHVPAGLAWELLVVNNNCTDDRCGPSASRPRGSRTPATRVSPRPAGN